MKPRKPAPLHRRLVWWLLGYLALISLAVFSVSVLWIVVAQRRATLRQVPQAQQE